MRKTKKFLAVVAATVSVLALAGCGKKEETKTLVIGTNAEFPPFEFVVSSGVIDKYDGVDMAIAKQLAEDMGLEPKVENMEFDSTLIALQNGQVDIVASGMTIDKERAEEVDFSVPYFVATQVMIVKEDSAIAKASDMEDKKIVVIQGYTGETCVRKLGYKYEAFKRGTEAVMELINGKCDVVVIDSATALSYIGDNEGLKVVYDNEAFGSEEYGIAVQKGNKELLDKVNETLNRMLSDGTIDKLVKKYGEVDAE